MNTLVFCFLDPRIPSADMNSEKFSKLGFMYHSQISTESLIFSQILTWGILSHNHHFCLPFKQHLVKSGCKIKFPRFRIQYCNPKDIRSKLEHSVFFKKKMDKIVSAQRPQCALTIMMNHRD